MSFLKYANETVTYPYNTRADHPNTAFPGGSDYPEFDIYWVHPTAQNNPDPETLNIIEDTPVFNNELNRWEQAWNYVAKTAEELRLAKYNPAQFLQQMFMSQSFAVWMENFTSFQQTGLANTATNAKIDNNWTVMQSIYNQFKTGVAPSQAAIDEWQGYADANGIPFTF